MNCPWCNPDIWDIANAITNHNCPKNNTSPKSSVSTQVYKCIICDKTNCHHRCWECLKRFNHCKCKVYCSKCKKSGWYGCICFDYMFQ